MPTSSKRVQNAVRRPPFFMPAGNRHGYWLVVSCVLASILASGCSIKLAYNNADRLIRWSMDDYIDFTGPQKGYLSAELKRLLYWHRTTQLPGYAHTLRQLNNDIARAVGGPQAVLANDFEGFVETALAWGEAAELKARRTGNQVLLSLTSEQIQQLPQKLAKDNRAMLKDELNKSTQQSQKRWAREVRKGLQRFTGRLTPSQLQFLTEQASSYEPERVLWIEYRRRWQAELMQLLVRRNNTPLDDDVFLAAFRDLADKREAYYGDFGPVQHRNEALALATTAGLLVRMSTAQQERFSDRLLEIAQDFEALVQEAEPTPPAALLATECLVPHASCPGVPLN